MSNTASQSELNALHAIVAKRYVELLENAPTAADLSSAAKFLKDNMIILVPESADALEEAATRFKDIKFVDDPDEGKTLQFPEVKEA